MIDSLLEKNLLPDRVIRTGIRRLLAQRIRDEGRAFDPDPDAALRAYAQDLDTRPVAENTAEANDQHYEVPTEFYQQCLGPRLKYSCCLYPTGRETLAEAENHMLGLCIERARLADGQAILELGCGWGSMTLYMAERFPGCVITAVSNSRTQKQFIDAEAARRGLHNIQVMTADMNDFAAAPARYDRIVSIEMFEHMKNYRRLLARVAGWLRPGGMLFVHIFTHSRFAYHFISSGPGDWMARHFFTGGQMPAHDLLLQFQDDLQRVADWKINGTHYQKTAAHWLQNMDANRKAILPLLAQTYGPDSVTRWWSYWRIFFMSCEELWGFRKGGEWIVSHYLFRKS